MAKFFLVLICSISLSLMLWASSQESPTMDEQAHIPAGYSYIRYLDYRLNPEHPPIVKALAGIPNLFFNLNFPVESSAWKTDVNGQWAVGREFLYESGNNADLIVGWSRVGPIFLTLLLIIFIYIWSSELLGKYWAILPALFFALSPNVIAHGHYVTTDIGAALGIFAATYYFIKYLFKQSRRNLICAGVALGIAQLLKFSAVLLIPYFLILLSIYYLYTLSQKSGEQKIKYAFVLASKYLSSVIILFFIAFALVVYPVYALLTLNYPQEKQTNDAKFILTSFAGGPPKEGETCKPARCLAEATIWMTKNPITKGFAEYMLGVLMVLQRSAGGHTGYFWGYISAAGSPFYFPTVYLLKEPLPVLVMVLLALFVSIIRIFRNIVSYKSSVISHFKDYLSNNFAEFSMLIFIIIYWAYSIQSPLNIGFRHLLPTIPFIYILTTAFWKKWTTNINLSGLTLSLKSIWNLTKTILFSSLKGMFILIMILWFMLETALAAPYFLSYFNQLGGGIWEGYKYVTDSNYDWGQDLLRLKKFVEEHPEIDKIGVDYFGAGKPTYYINKAENWWSAKGNPKDYGINWLAISVNTLQGAIQPTVPGQKRNPEDEYKWLTGLRPPKPGLGNVPEPDFKAGTSIFIYKL